MLHNMQFSFYSNLYLCMSFLSYDNNIVLTCGQPQLISTHDSDQLESSVATLVTVHD